MGLDVSVLVTPKELDLEELYAVKDTVEHGFYWYLGNDKEKVADRWKELKSKCESLTKDDILRNISGPDDLVMCLKGMSNETFDKYMEMIVASIPEHEDGNTHLNFDYDKLPGKDIMDSCSWNLRDLFLECKKVGCLRPCGDFICELDGYKVWAMAEKWKEQKFKMKVAKWIGYFSQRIGYNILGDCLRELGVRDVFVEFSDAEMYMENIQKVAKGILDNDDRYWLVSSY